MLKIMGALMILASATGIGVSCSMDLKKYCMELRLLKQLLYMLRGEIKYTKTPLAEAFERIAVRLPEPFSTFLRQTAQEMENLDGRTFGELWREQIRTGLPGTHLKKDDKEQLGALGEVLGYLDLEMQVSSIELYLEHYSKAEIIPKSGSGWRHFSGHSVSVIRKGKHERQSDI